MPPITRLIEHIDGINIDFVAQCLGVDPTKYKYSSGKANDHENENDPNLHNAILKTETQKQLKDRSIARFTMCCPNPNCGIQFEFPGVFQTSNKNGISGMQCEECKEVVPHKFIRNKIQLFLRHLLEVYYEGNYICNEPSCYTKTRQITVNNRCVNVACKGKVRGEFNEKVTNDTLRYLHGLFDWQKHKTENKIKHNEVHPHE